MRVPEGPMRAAIRPCDVVRSSKPAAASGVQDARLQGPGRDEAEEPEVQLVLLSVPVP